MSLETYTGKIADLVITNPTPTDPKSQGDDHLRGIKKTIVDDAVRVSGSPLQQLGASAAASENHHWDASVPNQLSLKRGTPDAPGAELIKALNGVLSFPNQGQSLAHIGYVKLPGGLIVQWGTSEHSSNLGPGWTSVAYPIPFSAAVFQVIGSTITNQPTFTPYYADVVLDSIGPLGDFSWVLYDKTGAPVAGGPNSQLRWIAIGY